MTVIQAMELPAMDMGGVSDPYVKVLNNNHGLSVTFYFVHQIGQYLQY